MKTVCWSVGRCLSYSARGKVHTTLLRVAQSFHLREFSLDLIFSSHYQRFLFSQPNFLKELFTLAVHIFSSLRLLILFLSSYFLWKTSLAKVANGHFSSSSHWSLTNALTKLLEIFSYFNFYYVVLSWFSS